MPLRDHFRPPLDDLTSGDGFHGQWPSMTVLALSRRLPQGYVAVPHVHLGSAIEIDAATSPMRGIIWISPRPIVRMRAVVSPRWPGLPLGQPPTSSMMPRSKSCEHETPNGSRMRQRFDPRDHQPLTNSSHRDLGHRPNSKQPKNSHI